MLDWDKQVTKLLQDTNLTLSTMLRRQGRPSHQAPGGWRDPGLGDWGGQQYWRSSCRRTYRHMLTSGP